MPPPEIPFAAPDSSPDSADAPLALDHSEEFYRAEVARIMAEACRQAAGRDGPAPPGSTSGGWAGSAFRGTELASASGGSLLSMWSSVASSASGRAAKCPRCRTVCSDDDGQCPACRAPIEDGPSELSPAARGRRASRLGLLCLALGAGLGPIIGSSLPLVARPAGGPDANLILWACLGGVVGAVAGYVLGLVTSNLRQPG